jgi:hypothetical protein
MPLGSHVKSVASGFSEVDTQSFRENRTQLPQVAVSATGLGESIDFKLQLQSSNGVQSATVGSGRSRRLRGASSLLARKFPTGPQWR